MHKTATPMSSSAQAMLEDIAAYRASRSHLPLDACEAEAKLLSRGLGAGDIQARREAFTTHQNVDRTSVLLLRTT
jgi:hypothetical protein